jgi:hypothetical protein
MPDDPKSNVPGNRGVGDPKDRYWLAASQLNIELSRCGGPQTLRDTYLLAASRLNVELSRCGGPQTLLEAARVQQPLTAGMDRGFNVGRQEYVAGFK